MGILRALVTAVNIGFFGGELLTISCVDKLKRLALGIFRDSCRICPHVGNQAHDAIGADRQPLVQTLRQRHGLSRREAQPIGPFLLQSAGK